jgi:hypothetical protein
MTAQAIQRALHHLERGQVGEAQVVLHEALGDFDTLQGEIEAELAEPLPVCLRPLNPVSQRDGS